MKKLGDTYLPCDYREMALVFCNRQKLVVDEFREERINIEQLISLLIRIGLEVIENSDNQFSEKNPESYEHGLAFALSDRNMHYIIAAYRNFLDGLLDPALAHTRTILETAMALYGVKYANLAEFYKKQSEIFKKIDEKRKNGTSPELMELEKELKNLAKIGTTIRRMADELYEGEKRDRIKRIETELDVRAHASIRGAASNQKYDKEIYKEVILSMEVIFLFNLIAVSDVFADELSDGLRKDIIKYANKLSKKLPIPNKPNIKKQLKIRKD